MKSALVTLYLLLSWTCVSVTSSCGGDLVVAGASSANRLVRTWLLGYNTLCPTARVTIDDSSSSTGAARVCGVRRKATAVDIGSMRRPMNRLEASSNDGWRFQCERSTRSTIQIDVGIQGVALATGKYGAASRCVQLLGGLSHHQLRWMYSALTETELINEYDGWDFSSIANSDGDDATRLWSELHEGCDPVEVMVLGLPPNTSGFAYMSLEVFKARNEEISPERFTSVDENEALATHVNAYTNAVAFFDIQYFLSETKQASLESVHSVSVSDKSDHGGVFISPNFALFEGGQYPLASRVVLNLNSDNMSLHNIRPLLDYGFSPQGTEALESVGFRPLPGWEREVMNTRAQTTWGVPLANIKKHCGPENHDLSIAGSTTVHPVARLWSELYRIGCDSKIVLEPGGSSTGAGRVCANPEFGAPVDVGNMSREWKNGEAAEREAAIFDCLKGDMERSVIQIPVAVDGVVMGVGKTGVAFECIQQMGGLTTDQLRWIYSSYSDEELVATGWNPSSIPNSDGDSSTHLWSELHHGCPQVEIFLSGRNSKSGTHSFFKDTILLDHDNGESFAETRGSLAAPSDSSQMDLVLSLGHAIAYISYSNYGQHRDRLFAIPIQHSSNKDVFVTPTDETVGGGSYGILSRRIYMNLLDEPESILRSVPFVTFGLQELRDYSSAVGFVPLPKDEVHHLIQTRLEPAVRRAMKTINRMERAGARKVLVSVLVVWVTLLSIGVVAFFRVVGRPSTCLPRNPEQPGSAQECSSENSAESSESSAQSLSKSSSEYPHDSAPKRSVSRAASQAILCPPI